MVQPSTLANGRRGIGEELTNGMRQVAFTIAGMDGARGVGAELTILAVEEATPAGGPGKSSIRKRLRARWDGRECYDKGPQEEPIRANAAVPTLSACVQ